VFLSIDSSPWSAVRGSPELRAYSSMPRGSVPWPQRNGGSGGVIGAATRVGRPAPTAVRPTKPDDSPAQRQPAVYVNTVHLVDTCGHVIDMHTVPETTAGTAIADVSSLQTSGDVDHSGGGNESEDDRRKQVATALTGCLSRVQEDLKHIPPGKLLLTLIYFLMFTVSRDSFCLLCRRMIKCLITTSIKMLNLVILVGIYN